MNCNLDMTSNFLSLFKRFIKTALAITMVVCLIFTPFPQSAEASRPQMSGNYIDDTVSVSQSLQEIISSSQNIKEKSDTNNETIELITAYISRYRNRSQVNQSLSFRTMQTALNAMAGHYKTFPNRPMPDQLKERLNQELTKAEQLATNES